GGTAIGVTGLGRTSATPAVAEATSPRGRSSSRGYCPASPRADADSTMHAPASTSTTVPSAAVLVCTGRPSNALLFDGSTRMPLVDPLSVIHHEPFSSQNSQCRRLA